MPVWAYNIITDTIIAMYFFGTQIMSLSALLHLLEENWHPERLGDIYVDRLAILTQMLFRICISLLSHKTSIHINILSFGNIGILVAIRKNKY